MSQLLSPPLSPRDHRHFIPRRPSPLSLPPMAPTLSIGGGGHASFQPFSLDAFVVDSPRAGAKVPRYPLEKQRRAWKELEDRKQQQQMQPSSPMDIAAGGSRDMLSPTMTLPLTPRTPASSASSRYSQHDPDDASNGKSKPPAPPSFCATLFGSCFAVFHKSSQHIEAVHLRQGITSAR